MISSYRYVYKIYMDVDACLAGLEKSKRRRENKVQAPFATPVTILCGQYLA